MADTDRIKRNLSKMIDQGAPEDHLNSYLASEGFNSPEEWNKAIARPSWSEAFGNIPSDISKTVDEITSLPGKVGQASALAAYKAGHDPLGFAKDIAMAPVNLAKAGSKELLNQGGQITGAITAGRIGETTDEAVARREAERKQAIERPLTTVANIALQGVPSGELTAGGLALKGTTAATREAANIPTYIAAGVGRQSSNKMLTAGKAGGADGSAALAQMRGGNPLPVANQAINAAGELAADKNAAYLADKATWNTPGANADVNVVQQAHANALAANTMPATGAARNADAAAALKKVQELINEHTTIPAGRTPQATWPSIKLNTLTNDEMDALKQAIGSLTYGQNALAPRGTAAGSLVDEVRAAAKGAITDPAYADAMERSQGTIQNLTDLRKEMSLGGKNPSKGTILGKLQSAMRNDVSSKFGARGEFLNQLATKEPTLPAALAGQDFSAWYPRGLSRLVPGIEAGAALAHGVPLEPHTIAAALAALALSSPRLAGEARYGVGALSRYAGNIGITQQNIGRLLEAARIAGLKSGTNALSSGAPDR